MNDGQKKFYSFIMDRVSDDKKQQAQDLLEESFSKQADGTFNSEYLQAFIPQMMACIQEEAREEVQNIMMNFRNH